MLRNKLYSLGVAGFASVVIAGTVFLVVGCADCQDAAQELNASKPKVAPLDVEITLVRRPSEDPPSEKEIVLRSTQWKADRRVDDFLWVVFHAVPAGTSKARVRELLGSPLRETCSVDGGAQWTYIDPSGDGRSLDSLFLGLDPKGVVRVFAAVPLRGNHPPHENITAVRMPPQTPTDVRAAFVAQARPIVKDLADDSWREAAEWLLAQKGRLSVVRKPYSCALHDVVDTIKESEYKRWILCGTVEDLRRDGECWSVGGDAGNFGGISGYLDVRTGDLVFFRLTPEG